jgi:hypothetical protein
MESHGQEPPQEMPEVLKTFFDQTRPPTGQGDAYFELNWTVLLMFVPYLGYLLALFQIPHVHCALLVYSMVLIVLYCILMARFKEHMAYVSNPFDFVKVELMTLLNVVVFFGLGYFFLSKTGGNNFNQALRVFDGVYFSFVTISTIGYGDIHPVSDIGKTLVIFEICVAVWFFVTVIPVAVADQAERVRHFRMQRQQFAEAMKKSFEKGELVKAPGLRNDPKV